MTTETDKNCPPVEISDSKDIYEVETESESKQQNQDNEHENANKGDCEKSKCLGKSNVAPVKDVLVHKTDFEKDLVYLYQLPRSQFLPSLSPYCLKVETWLRLNGIKYEVSNMPQRFLYLRNGLFLLVQKSPYKNSVKIFGLLSMSIKIINRKFIEPLAWL